MLHTILFFYPFQELHVMFILQGLPDTLGMLRGGDPGTALGHCEPCLPPLVLNVHRKTRVIKKVRHPMCVQCACATPLTHLSDEEG